MFQNRLHNARKAAGLLLRDLGEQVGVSHAAIKKYEDGTAMPSSDILIRLLASSMFVQSIFFGQTLWRWRGLNIVSAALYLKSSLMPFHTR